MRNSIVKLALWMLKKSVKSNLVSYAEREFVRAGWSNNSGGFECEMQKAICDNVCDMLRVLSVEGHSGSSAPYAISLFSKLAKFEPIAPIIGAADEWNEVGDDVYQNKFVGSVFKNGKNGRAYWLDHYVFKDKDGCCFTSSRSRQFIEFPWLPPEPTYVDVDSDEEGNTIYPDYIKAIEP
jgi:hypothetical protein